MPFSKLGLSSTLLTNIANLGYSEPTPVQKQAIPVALEDKDIIAAARTGTGKTAAFALPLIEKLDTQGLRRPKYCRALILAPTRELALQIETNIQQYSQSLDVHTLSLVGGVKLEPQKQKLIDGVDVVIATPGRLIDLIYQRAIRIEEVETLVLDEADRMLDMGFIDDIEKILERLPSTRQNLLFSATLSNEVRSLAKAFMFKPIQISVEPQNKTQTKVEQWLVTVDKANKSSLLSHLIKENQWQQALIFIRTKHGAAKLVSQLEKRGIRAEAIHGDRSQEVRSQILADFKSGKISFLVSTDVSARGIDIEQLDRVINYDLPNAVDDYIHRIGRTARAGASGEAVSLVSYDDFKSLCAIEHRLGHIITRKEVEEFTPKKVVPVSVLNFVPKNPKTKVHGKKDSRPPKTGKDKKKNIKQKQRSDKSKASGKPAKKPDSNPWAGALKKRQK
jgi:superfamily II DNA/RNA helicase